jgi:CheY-specific phosphatase CheX
VYKLITLGIFIPILILTASNAHAVTSADRYNNGFSHGEQQAATDFQNHSPFRLACGKHTSYYCAGWFKGYTTKWNSLVRTNPHTIPPPPITSSVKANISSMPASNSTATISIHTVNTIQGSNNTILIQEEPLIRKVIASNINAILMAEGSVKGNISVSVNTKVINQLANRVSTTQGIDYTKELVATELVDAINAIKTNGNTTLVVDNQAICISPPTKAACAFTITIHS